jgi:hypothetical protein
MSTASLLVNTEVDILSRVVAPDRATFTPELAEVILAMELDPADRDRLRLLSRKVQEGDLTAAEQAELESYRRVGYFLDLIRSKARRSLQSTSG